jgi:hypothetical protein
LNLNLGGDRTICANQTALLSSNIQADFYTWSDVNGVIATSPTILVGDGTYSLNVIDSVGCVDTDSVQIIRSSLSLEAHFLAVSSIQEGDTLKVVNLSYPEPFITTWDFGDFTTSWETSPTHIYNQSGVYDIKLSVTNNFCSDSLIKQITVFSARIDPVDDDSLYEISNFIQYNVFPNPNNGNFTLNIELTSSAFMETTILNILGKEIGKYTFNGDLIEQQFSLKDLGSGIYFIRTQTGKQVRTAKIFIR